MMKQILYILLGIMLLSIVSCYDDEGNYDYHDINEVTFGEINTMYWLFRLHNILPRDFTEMSSHEQMIMAAFVHQEIEDIRKENEQLNGK